MENDKMTTNEAWKKLIEKYNIIEKIKKNGIFKITANQIKKFKEPRLMAKWDSTDSLPEVLRNNKINILPDSRSSYVLGDFILYQSIPELEEHVTQMAHVDIPDFETIDIKNINSESKAINVLIVSGILDDFLNSPPNVSTFNGRMGTGEFDFFVNTYKHNKCHINVKNAQCEIDGGFENDESVVIMEAKNVVHEDFHIRQLYYPYRLWETKVNKPIRLVFSIYSNKIYRLFEYRFRELNDYSSIELVNAKNYSLQDIKITLDDLIEVRNNTNITTDDNQNSFTNNPIPFIQADSMDRIISMLENMYDNPMTTLEISELMQFELRQSNYYYNAGRYLGLFIKSKNSRSLVELTNLGKDIYRMDYKKRQLTIVSLILRHKIFADFFDYMIKNGEQPPKSSIKNKMREYNVCNEGQIERRATSVNSWLKWIFNLTRL